MKQRIAMALVAAAGLAAPALVQAQAYPSKPITWILPFPPGGVTDPVARMVGQKVAESVGQQVIIDNRPGAGSIIAAEAVKRAAPDGYTLLFGHAGSHAVNPYLYAKLPYDAQKDFVPVTNLISTTHVLVVPASSPARTVADLVALAKAKQGLNYGSQGIGAGGHLLGEVFKLRIGAPLNHIPYKGSGPLVQDLLAARVDLAFDSPITSGPHVREGRLRALAVASPTHNRNLPGVPTVAEVGFAGMELDFWFGLFAPAGTPPALVQRLHKEFVQAINHPEVSRKILDTGLDITTSRSPEEFAALVAADAARLGRIVKDSGARVD
jgi:tripartite-type tricarboxylate transporter receptor subunit TctC